MESLTLSAPAKINFSLDITGRRADGYHTLRSVFQTISLCDTLILEKTPQDREMTLLCDDPDVPCDERNLVWKAAAALLGDSPRGLQITLRKRIPSRAGLGGGSSDCAAALRGIRALLGLSVSDTRLSEIAASLGADVPFFLLGSTALAEGVGEKLTPLSGAKERCFVLAKGSEGISTPLAYKALDALKQSPPPHTDAVLGHLGDESDAAFFSVCGNDFDAVANLPEIVLIRAIMRDYGLYPVLSGSGAAVFGGGGSREVLRACATRLRQEGIPFATVCSTASSDQ